MYIFFVLLTLHYIHSLITLINSNVLGFELSAFWSVVQNPNPNPNQWAIRSYSWSNVSEASVAFHELDSNYKWIKKK